MKTYSLTIQERSEIGRKVSTLREQGIVPAVIYGHDFAPINVQVGYKDFEKVYAEAGESSVVTVQLGSNQYPVIIKDVARNTVSDSIIHIDFYKVNLKEKIDAVIPLNFVGESPAVKDFGGILIKSISEVEVEGLPADLPPQIDVDLSLLRELNSQIILKDVAVSAKLKIKTDLDSIVALVQEAAPEEVFDVAAAPTTEEVEIIKREKKEDEPVEE